MQSPNQRNHGSDNIEESGSGGFRVFPPESQYECSKDTPENKKRPCEFTRS